MRIVKTKRIWNKVDGDDIEGLVGTFSPTCGCSSSEDQR